MKTFQNQNIGACGTRQHYFYLGTSDSTEPGQQKVLSTVQEIRTGLGPIMKNPRSINDSVPVYLVFLNKSNRSVQIIWVNYAGDEVLYQNLAPKTLFKVRSFVTHPWIVRDKLRHNLVPFDAIVLGKRKDNETNDPIVSFIKDGVEAGKPVARHTKVLFPIPHERTELIFALVYETVLSLKKMCFNYFLENCPSSASSLLANVPKTLRLEYEQYCKKEPINPSDCTQNRE